MSLYASGIIRIISDPTLKSFDSGTQVANFAGGIQEGKNAKTGEWINNVIDVEIWGKSAEVVIDRCKKGDSLMVTGNVKRQDWEDKKPVINAVSMYWLSADLSSCPAPITPTTNLRSDG